jgi:hypothetical protein
MTKDMTNFVIGIATTFVAVGISYGVCISKISQLEQQASQIRLDHDSVISLVTKFDTVLEDLKEIKIDLKEIKTKIK